MLLAIYRTLYLVYQLIELSSIASQKREAMRATESIIVPIPTEILVAEEPTLGWILKRFISDVIPPLASALSPTFAVINTIRNLATFIWQLWRGGSNSTTIIVANSAMARARPVALQD